MAPSVHYYSGMRIIKSKLNADGRTVLLIRGGELFVVATQVADSLGRTFLVDAFDYWALDEATEAFEKR